MTPAPNDHDPRQLAVELMMFAKEDPALSVRHLLVAFGLCLLAEACAAGVHWWPLRLVGSLLAGLMQVRLFILYHDHMHGSLLKHSRLARCFFYFYGLYALSPPSIWRYTHNYHHAHNTLIKGSHIGGFWLMDTTMWAQASRWTRTKYRALRHPLNILFAYFTVFLFGMCVASLHASPKRNLDSALALALHVGLVAGLGSAFGWALPALCIVAPLAIASVILALGFYVQHAFEGIVVLEDAEWSYLQASLQSTCYLRMGRGMNWISGNIGYHHIHHLNPGIPFYRLPDAMADTPALQQAPTVNVGWREISNAFRLKLWDPQQRRMVGFRP